MNIERHASAARKREVQYQALASRRTRKRRTARLTLAAAMAVIAPSCIPLQYSTNPQGQLQSIGLPGLPVWQSQSLKQQKQEAASGDLAAAPGTTLDPDAAGLMAFKSDEPWLTVLNGWRSEAGVEPIGENAGLSDAAQDHACCLVKNGPNNPADFLRYEQTIDGAAHNESPANPYFTTAGNRAAHTGDISWERNPEADVNSLMDTAFHRLSLLAPWVRVAGYGGCGRFPMRAATLVARGSTPTGTMPTVIFPPAGSVVRGIMEGSEWPNPLDACPGYQFPAGVPITVQTGADVNAFLQSFEVRDATTGQEVAACGFDSRTFPGEHGRQVLLSYGAVVVMPRAPLTPGHAYRVKIVTRLQVYSWDFQVAGTPPSARTARVD